MISATIVSRSILINTPSSSGVSIPNSLVAVLVDCDRLFDSTGRSFDNTEIEDPEGGRAPNEYILQYISGPRGWGAEVPLPRLVLLTHLQIKLFTGRIWGSAHTEGGNNGVYILFDHCLYAKSESHLRSEKARFVVWLGERWMVSRPSDLHGWI